MSGSAIITTATTPTISISPNTNQTICSGQSITFTTSSNVGSCSITWQESPATGTAVWTSIPGATFSTYTVSPSSSKKYRVGYTCGACNVAISTAITVTVNPTPNTYTVTGGGTYCTGGNGVSIGLSGSQSGVTYQLKLNGNNTGLTINGTGSAITFPNQTNQGTYTVVATNTNGCTTTMTGNAIVSVTSNPTVYTLTGGGAYCAGGIGVPIGLSGFQTGVTYVLSRDGVFVSSINSSGGNINFGNQTIAGTYTVVATTNSGGCTAAMSNSVTVSIISVPTQYNITGGGSYCAGSGGVAIGLSDSEVGVTYQLQLNGNNVGTPITGNNNAIGFGNQNNAGTYTVIANNNGCTLAMLGTASVIINSTPTAAISPSGAISVCSGQSTQLTASGGTSYQWSNSLGTSATINPTLSNPTTYTVTVTGANGCTATATKNVTVNTLPTAAISASGATTFCQGSSVNLTATGGNSYAWSSGSNATGITASTAGVYTVTVSNANNCTASVSTSVTVNPLPTTPIINYNGAVAGANIAACDEAALSIATTNGISYQWKKNNNATAVTSANYNTSSSGIFTVQATNNATGCQSVSDGVNLTIYALPPALLTAEGSTALCPQDSLKLKASPTGSSYTYLWSDGATGSNNWVSDAGTYTVTVTRNYGAISCSAVADAITLTQRPAPTAQATYITQNNTTTFTNQSTEAVSYIWDFGDDTPLITETNPTHTYLSEGYFTVQLTAINTDGCENTSSFGVLIMPLAGNTQSVLFPNPNNGNFTLNLQLAKASVVVVDVFDVTGRLIKRFESTQTIGLASLNFAIPQLSSGIYLLGVYIDDTTSNYTNFEHGLLANKPLKYHHYRKLLVVD
jgi:PKD repeat protein